MGGRALAPVAAPQAIRDRAMEKASGLKPLNSSKTAWTQDLTPSNRRPESWKNNKNLRKGREEIERV